MLEEALLAVAGAVGTAVVKAMATDGWAAARTGLSRLFGRAGKKPEVIEEQLDDDADTLERASETERDQVRAELAPVWRRRIVKLLEDCPDDERAALADDLAALFDALTPTAPVGGAGQSVSASVAGRDINQVGSVGGDFTTGGSRD